MRCVLLMVAALSGAGCASLGGRHGGGVPVTWQLSAGSGDRSGRTVCRSAEPATPCAIDRGTPERPVFATFQLHVWSPTAGKFTGSLLVAFFGHIDPHKFEAILDLAPNGNEVHHSVTDQVTSIPGSYNVRVHLQESGADLPTPRVHDLVIPVHVK